MCDLGQPRGSVLGGASSAQGVALRPTAENYQVDPRM